LKNDDDDKDNDFDKKDNIYLGKGNESRILRDVHFDK
jgi:hypothetical protein